MTTTQKLEFNYETVNEFFKDYQDMVVKLFENYNLKALRLTKGFKISMYMADMECMIKINNNNNNNYKFNVLKIA